MQKICQSCAMPLIQDEDFGVNADGSRNEEYCHYCFKDGQFTMPNLTKEEMIGRLVEMADEMKMTEIEAKKMAEKVVPQLKRWQGSK